MSVANFSKFKDYKGPSKKLVDQWWISVIDWIKSRLRR